jgi:hypothetical protein
MQVSEEDAKAEVLDDATVARSCRTNVDPATESSKLCQVGERSAAHFIWTRWAVTVGKKVVDPNVMVECVGPEIKLQVCAR